MEAAGQHVDQEPADELVRVERHRLVAAGSVDPIVLDLKRHRLAIGRDQTPVRDRHAVRVARQIGEHRLGPGERALGVDVPARPLERRQIGGERLHVDERGVRAVERQPAGGVCGHEPLDHQPAEQLRQHAHRQKEVGPLGDPP